MCISINIDLYYHYTCIYIYISNPTLHENKCVTHMICRLSRHHILCAYGGLSRCAANRILWWIRWDIVSKARCKSQVTGLKPLRMASEFLNWMPSGFQTWHVHRREAVYFAHGLLWHSLWSNYENRSFQNLTFLKSHPTQEAGSR